MLNFDYHNPTRIVFGAGSVARLDEQVPADARVLILYGGGSAERNGTLAEVEAALAPRVTRRFGGIEPNPSYETLMQAVELARSERLDFLLAVGGGSVLDGSKFVAAAVDFPSDRDPWAIVTSRGAAVERALPLGTVLTLSATGSEANGFAVISRRSLQAKLGFFSPLVFPRFSVIDPAKTFTLPPRQVANGVVDAFIHVTEQYLTYPVDARVQDRYAEGLLQTLIEIGPLALAQPQDYAVRANLSWAATQALNGLIGAGVPQDWATHQIGHEITAAHGLDHAQTLAIVLPALLQLRRDAKRDKLLQYAERVWNLREGDDEARIDAAIARTRAFFESLGVPTRLGAYGLTAADVGALVERLQARGMTALGERGEIDTVLSRRILEAAL